jgi:protein OS-9
VVKEYARASHVELQRGAGAHYLVERWHDGTLCDKTGRPREIEVQFHCSMGGPDTILFVKETRTCAYVLVVHTPRLCAVPGFRAPQDAHEQAEVRCRQVVDELGSTNPLLPPSEVPAGLVVQVPSIPAPPVTAPPAKGQAASNIRQLVDRLLGPDMDVSDVVIEQLSDGSYVIELAEDVDYADDYGAGGDGYGYSQGDDAGGNAGDNVREEALLEMLRAAGIDVAGYVTTPRPPKSEADKDAAEQRKKEKKSSTPPPK